MLGTVLHKTAVLLKTTFHKTHCGVGTLSNKLCGQKNKGGCSYKRGHAFTKKGELHSVPPSLVPRPCGKRKQLAWE